LRSRIAVAFVTLLLTAGCGSSENKTPTTPTTVEITLTTADSLNQTAWFTFSPEKDKAPLFVLLPMLGKTHESFQPFIDSVRAYVEQSRNDSDIVMPSFLAFDLRGHGQSVTVGDREIHYADMGDTDFVKIPGDVAEMTNKVISEYGIDIDHMVVVGASIGANTAMLLTEKLPFISKVVMLSPGVDYRGLKPSEAFKEYKGQTLIVTGNRDRQSFIGSQQIAKEKMVDWLLKIYQTADHGTNLINADPRAMHTVIKWIFTGEESGFEGKN
jgi:pimeloyl-ACP methyl ester carboxylesterase